MKNWTDMTLMERDCLVAETLGNEVDWKTLKTFSVKWGFNVAPAPFTRSFDSCEPIRAKIRTWTPSVQYDLGMRIRLLVEGRIGIILLSERILLFYMTPDDLCRAFCEVKDGAE